jgi:hypothetical protein
MSTSRLLFLFFVVISSVLITIFLSGCLDISHEEINMVSESPQQVNISQNSGSWISIDPVKNVTLGEPIFINGSTNFSAGELLTVSLTREITPGGGRECGKRFISIEMNTPVRPGYGLTNTWSTVLNTSEFCGGRSPTIAVWAVNHTQIIQYSSIIINDPIEEMT